MKKKKRKFRRFVFAGTVSLATLDGITISQGTEVKVYEEHIIIHGMKYARVPEIELFIRDGKLVPAKSEAASQAIGRQSTREQETLRTRSTEPVDFIEDDGSKVKRVRGMVVEDGTDDYTEIPIPPTPTEREEQRRTARASTGRAVTEEMKEVAVVGRTSGLSMEEIAATVGAVPTPTGERTRKSGKKKRKGEKTKVKSKKTKTKTKKASGKKGKKKRK